MPENSYFERTIKLFLGTKKAANTAGMVNNKKKRRKLWLKTIDRITENIRNLDTFPEHKDILKTIVGQLQEDIEKSDEPNWKTVCILLRLCGSLLGYAFIPDNPTIWYSHIYYQDEEQYYTKKILSSADYHKKNDLEEIRKEKFRIAKRLHAEGRSTFKIGLILNINEAAVIKLLKKRNLKTDDNL